jgi:hypothetical protein
VHVASDDVETPPACSRGCLVTVSFKAIEKRRSGNAGLLLGILSAQQLDANLSV